MLASCYIDSHKNYTAALSLADALLSRAEPSSPPSSGGGAPSSTSGRPRDSPRLRAEPCAVVRAEPTAEPAFDFSSRYSSTSEWETS